MKFGAGEFTSVDVTKVKNDLTVVETIHPRDGVYSTNDPHEIDALRSLGLPERTDAQVKAAKASRKTRGGTKTVKVVDETTGAVDTRGPGAPAVEAGITEVGS